MSEWTLCSNDLAPGITSGSFFYYENAAKGRKRKIASTCSKSSDVR